MKWIIPCFLVLLFLISCSEICYKEPQPKGVRPLTEIPGKLHGRYMVSDENGSVDTLIVFNKGYRIGKDDVASLSDSLVLKYHKGFYFINIRDDVAWYLRVVKQEKNGDIRYMAMPEATSEYKGGIFKDVLARDIPVAETEVDGKTHYIIDPSPKKLLELIRKEYFNDQTFKKID
ncbi:MAG: hypothetical protein KF803_05720 [Cyclobacteriaceae bacterium]|nr:hypothetical protein [Cyclobacteriaceae bacterium]